MILKTLILTTLLMNDPMITAIPPEETKLEVGRKRGKGQRGRRRGGNGLR